MRWSIVRLIWWRELRDQLRDRRTVFMIAFLPLVLYPLLGFGVMHFAMRFVQTTTRVGIALPEGAAKAFPIREPKQIGQDPRAWASVFAAADARLEHLIGAVALVRDSRAKLDYPPLVEDSLFAFADPAMGPLGLLGTNARLKVVWLAPDDGNALEENRVDVILQTSPDFFRALEQEERALLADSQPPLGRPEVQIRVRRDEDSSRLALQRLKPVLDEWRNALKSARLARRGLDAAFDRPFEFREPETGSNEPRSVFDLMIRIFPFMLVIWSLAGALYPAVDICAGEKERGTMETLLITPAGREEIVVGKFLTIWVFSAASALLNLASMGFTTSFFGSQFLGGTIPIGALLWSVVLALPLSALFSAISLAIGAYARSSKEGQYYLMPMFLLTMPLIFMTLAPGVELNPYYSLVPITGVALLMHKLMAAQTFWDVPWLYFIPVLGPICLYVFLALKWAIDQFHREEVLFREAERLDLRLWLRHWLRDKEITATTGQAFFCFALILGFRWFSMGLGRQLSVIVHTGVVQLGFVAAPALFMAVLLSKKPTAALHLRASPRRWFGVAALIALLLLPPMVEFAMTLFERFPHLERIFEERHPLLMELRNLVGDAPPWTYFLVFAILPAICEELAFRGYILNGLLKRFRPRSAILLTSFLFALFHMNVFQFLPAFFLGVILGLLTVRSRSLYPAMAFHFLYNALLLSSPLLRSTAEEWMAEGWIPPSFASIWPVFASLCLGLAVALIWWLYRKPYVDLARALAAEAKQSPLA
jgi:sodium transport system permease protein